LRCVKKGSKFFKRKWLDFEENDNETVLRNQVVRKTREIERTKKMGKKFFVEKRFFSFICPNIKRKDRKMNKDSPFVVNSIRRYKQI
jgi:hypothetical protein